MVHHWAESTASHKVVHLVLGLDEKWGAKWDEKMANQAVGK